MRRSRTRAVRLRARRGVAANEQIRLSRNGRSGTTASGRGCVKTKTDLAVNQFCKIQTSKSRRFESRLGFLARFAQIAKVPRVVTQPRSELGVQADPKSRHPIRRLSRRMCISDASRQSRHSVQGRHYPQIERCVLPRSAAGDKDALGIWSMESRDGTGNSCVHGVSDARRLRPR